MSKPTFGKLSLKPETLKRGFWLYVWRVKLIGKTKLYVGRTGDSSHPNAASPYNRFGQHFGSNKNANALKKHLEQNKLENADIKSCDFIYYGPIFDEQADMDSHKPLRDRVAALEKKLAESLLAAGYDVMNTVNSRKTLVQSDWTAVKSAFSEEFDGLNAVN